MSNKLLPANKVTFNKNRLVFEANNKKKELNLAYGSILSKKLIEKYDFFYEADTEGKILKLIAKPQKESFSPEDDSFVKLYPTYYNDNINFTPCAQKENDTFKLLVRAVKDSYDIAIINAILSLLHYKNTPTRGYRLLLEFASNEEKDRFIKWSRNINRNQKKTKAIKNLGFLAKSIESDTKIIGCLVVDQMNFGTPKGRFQIALSMGEADSENREKHKDLTVLWISRVAVLPSYQKFGFAELLPKNLAEAGYLHLLPLSKFIEVIITVPKEDASKIIEGKKIHFFQRAGYSVDPQLLPAKNMIDFEGNPMPCKRLYFYKETGKSGEKN